MIILDATTKILELSTSSTSSTDYYISWVDITTSAFTPGISNGNITTATTTTIVAAPSASTQRQIKHISIINKGTTTQNVIVKLDVSGTETQITGTISLLAGERLQYSGEAGFVKYNAAGSIVNDTDRTKGYNGWSVSFYKVGTAPEAAGQYYSHSKDTGNPGAFVIGTPGLAGRVTDGTTTTDAGCLPFRNAASGANYLTDYNVCASVAGHHFLYDVLWVNSGIVVTTTTAQTINSIAFPARDINGSTNGEGINIGILVTTATTNAGAITNTTMSYTNSDGVAGRTATMASYPATAVIGTFVPFQLQAGDRGVRSIQSVTLGTTRTAGALSLIAYRQIINRPVIVANVGTAVSHLPLNPGIKLYNGTCLLPFQLASATTATTITGTISVMEI